MKKFLGAMTALALVVLGVVAAPLSASANGTVNGTIQNSSAVGINNAVIEFQQGQSTNFYYTDASGNYSADVPNGTYTVYIHATGYAGEYYNDSYALSGATSVTVGQGSTQSINATLADASVITGHITDYAAGPVDAQVFAVSSNLATFDDWFRALTDPVTGAYTIEDLAPGTYRVWVSTDETDDLVDEWYQNQYTQASATPVVITTTGSSTTVDVQLQKGGEVSGTVENTIGSPVEISVLLNGPNGQYASTNSYGGAYAFHGVLPDTYTGTAHDGFGFFQDATSSPFSVTASTPASADFVVTPALVDESEFYASPVISGPSTVQAGKTYTWKVNVDGDSDAYAILYSDPVFLGVAAQDQNGVATLTLTIPANTPAGAHKLTWSSYETEFFNQDYRQYFPITVTAAAAAALPATGTDASLPIGFAAVLLLVGAALVGRRRLQV